MVCDGKRVEQLINQGNQWLKYLQRIYVPRKKQLEPQIYSFIRSVIKRFLTKVLYILFM